MSNVEVINRLVEIAKDAYLIEVPQNEIETTKEKAAVAYKPSSGHIEIVFSYKGDGIVAIPFCVSKCGVTSWIKTKNKRLVVSVLIFSSEYKAFLECNR